MPFWQKHGAVKQGSWPPLLPESSQRRLLLLAPWMPHRRHSHQYQQASLPSRSANCTCQNKSAATAQVILRSPGKMGVQWQLEVGVRKQPNNQTPLVGQHSDQIWRCSVNDLRRRWCHSWKSPGKTGRRQLMKGRRVRCWVSLNGERDSVPCAAQGSRKSAGRPLYRSHWVHQTQGSCASTSLGKVPVKFWKSSRTPDSSSLHHHRCVKVHLKMYYSRRIQISGGNYAFKIEHIKCLDSKTSS